LVKSWGGCFEAGAGKQAEDFLILREKKKKKKGKKKKKHKKKKKAEQVKLRGTST